VYWQDFLNAANRLATGTPEEQQIHAELAARFDLSPQGGATERGWKSLVSDVSASENANGCRDRWDRYKARKIRQGVFPSAMSGSDQLSRQYDTARARWDLTKQGKDWKCLKPNAREQAWDKLLKSTTVRPPVPRAEMDYFTPAEWEAQILSQRNPNAKGCGPTGAPMTPPLVQIYLDASEEVQKAMVNTYGESLLAQVCMRLGHLGETDTVKEMGFGWVLKE
jgi:hypothetical protein